MRERCADGYVRAVPGIRKVGREGPGALWTAARR